MEEDVYTSRVTVPHDLEVDEPHSIIGAEADSKLCVLHKIGRGLDGKSEDSDDASVSEGGCSSQGRAIVAEAMLACTNEKLRQTEAQVADYESKEVLLDARLAVSKLKVADAEARHLVAKTWLTYVDTRRVAAECRAVDAEAKLEAAEQRAADSEAKRIADRAEADGLKRRLHLSQSTVDFLKARVTCEERRARDFEDRYVDAVEARKAAERNLSETESKLATIEHLLAAAEARANAAEEHVIASQRTIRDLQRNRSGEVPSYSVSPNFSGSRRTLICSAGPSRPARARPSTSSSSDTNVTGEQQRTIRRDCSRVNQRNAQDDVASMAEASTSGGGSANIGDTCVFCLDPMRRGDRVVRLPCFHIFHEDCIMPYLRNGRLTRCPIDRTHIRSSIVEALPRWALGENSTRTAE